MGVQIFHDRSLISQSLHHSLQSYVKSLTCTPTGPLGPCGPTGPGMPYYNHACHDVQAT